MVDADRRAAMTAAFGRIVGDYAKRGEDLSADPRLAEAVLLDSFPNYPAEVRALVEAIRVGTVQSLLDRRGTPSEFLITGSAAQLAAVAGLRDDLAQWATESWWHALSPEASGPPFATPDGPGWTVVSPPTAPAAPGVGLGSAGRESVSSTAAGGPPGTESISTHGSTEPAGGRHAEVAPTSPAGVPPTSPQAFQGDPDATAAWGPLHTPVAADAPQSLEQPYQSAPPRSRPPRRWPIAAAIVIVLAAYGGIAAASHLPPFPSSTTSSKLPALYQQLANRIPSDLKCLALTAGQIAESTYLSGAGAAYDCVPIVGGSHIYYFIFTSKSRAEAAYDKGQGNLPRGNCAERNDVEGFYGPDGDSAHTGQLACFSAEGGAMALLWWRFSDNIIADTSSSHVSIATSYSDWKRLGPR